MADGCNSPESGLSKLDYCLALAETFLRESPGPRAASAGRVAGRNWQRNFTGPAFLRKYLHRERPFARKIRHSPGNQFFTCSERASGGGSACSSQQRQQFRSTDSTGSRAEVSGWKQKRTSRPIVIYCLSDLPPYPKVLKFGSISSTLGFH